MRFYKVLPLAAALASAIVIPDEHDMSQIAIQDHRKDSSFFSELEDDIKGAVDSAKNVINDAFDDASAAVGDAVSDAHEYAEGKYFDAENWVNDFHKAHQDEYDYVTEELDEEAVHEHWRVLKENTREWRDYLGLGGDHHHDEKRPCPDKDHRGPPVRGGPNKFRRPPPPPPEEDADHHHHHRRPGHGHKSNLTVYQIISKSKYTTKIAKLIDEFPDVVDMLNGTKSNFTIFVPTDYAFEKLPHHGKKPPKEFLLKVLQYHVVPELAPAGKVLKSRTLPTVLEGEGLSVSPKDTPQRLSINLGLKGLTVNFYSRVVAIDIFASNGIIHGVDSLLFPPPKAAQVIQFLPAAFSTLELGLVKTGLFPALNDTSTHMGGVLFAPSNRAFEKLPPKLSGFLFSKYGRKYLKALLEYHVVANTTLYSDKLYAASKDGESDDVDAARTFHIELPTLLKGRSLSIDVARFARFVDIRINGFNHVAATDGVTYDGVIHVLGNVLIPPKTATEQASWADSSMGVQELVERLEPLVREDEDEDDMWQADDDQHVDQDVFDIPLEL